MSKLQPVKGTHDIYGEDGRRFAQVVDTFKRVCSGYGFEELTTPIFEFTEVFKRPLGEASDIVSKEMYSFEDRGGEALTLRPEFTAGVARSFISNGMQQNLPCRFMSHGPAFRYERPQKGRYRQFHQINAEVLGLGDPATDVDVIAMGYRILSELGVADDVTLHINSLGDAESRNVYREALVDYLKDFEGDLSEDSQRRLKTNPLRILDSKNDGDKAIVANAPKMSAYMNDVSRDFFAYVCSGLDAAGIPYVHDETLVRGMDYYTHTAFEFITETLGSQGAVIAGGRYDGLIKQLGGPPTAGIGWAGGIERLAMMISEPNPKPQPIVMMPMGEAAEFKCITLSQELRSAGLTITSDRSGNLKKRMNRANNADASHVLILGDDELAKGVITMKDLSSGFQLEIAMDNVSQLAQMLGSEPTNMV